MPHDLSNKLADEDLDKYHKIHTNWKDKISQVHIHSSKCQRVNANKNAMAMTRIKYKLANKRAEQEIGILLNMNRRKTQYEY